MNLDITIQFAHGRSGLLNIPLSPHYHSKENYSSQNDYNSNIVILLKYTKYFNGMKYFLDSSYVMLSICFAFPTIFKYLKNFLLFYMVSIHLNASTDKTTAYISSFISLYEIKFYFIIQLHYHCLIQWFRQPRINFRFLAGRDALQIICCVFCRVI